MLKTDKKKLLKINDIHSEFVSPTCFDGIS